MISSEQQKGLDFLDKGWTFEEAAKLANIPVKLLGEAFSQRPRKRSPSPKAIATIAFLTELLEDSELLEKEQKAIATVLQKYKERTQCQNL